MKNSIGIHILFVKIVAAKNMQRKATYRNDANEGRLQAKMVITAIVIVILVIIFSLMKIAGINDKSNEQYWAEHYNQ